MKFFKRKTENLKTSNEFSGVYRSLLLFATKSSYKYIFCDT